MNWTANVHVTVKQNVLDPQGKAVQRALTTMGYAEVASVRIGKLIEVQLEASDEAVAAERVKQMCDTLLANTVVEEYRFELRGGDGA